MTSPLDNPLTLAERLRLQMSPISTTNMVRFAFRGEPKVDWAGQQDGDGLYTAAMCSLWWILKHSEGRVTVLSSDLELTKPFWDFIQAAVAVEDRIAELVTYPARFKMVVGPNPHRKITVLPPVPVAIAGIHAKPHLGVVLGAGSTDLKFETAVEALEAVTQGQDRLIEVW